MRCPGSARHAVVPAGVILAVVLATTGCTGAPVDPATPSSGATASFPADPPGATATPITPAHAPSPTVKGTTHAVAVNAATTVAATVRWTDGKELFSRRLAAGRAGEWKLTVPADFQLVVTVAGDDAGKVTCSIRVDGEAAHGIHSTETSASEGSAISLCEEDASRPAASPGPTSAPAHLVGFHATSTGEMTLFWSTPNGSRRWNGGGDYASKEWTSAGEVRAVAANGAGAATCEVTVDERVVSTQAVTRPGEIALCRTAVK